MVFDISEKIALITGGASGIGLHYAKELLRNGLQGVTLADVNPSAGASALEELEKEFGPNKAIFVHTDVRDRQQFESAFKKTVETFKYVDILFNNAGIMNDTIWNEELDVNVKGTIIGILLAIEDYFPKYKQGPEAVIVNIASTAAFDFYPHIPIYCSTKAAVSALTKCWGVPHFYDKLKVRFTALCPGPTITPILSNISGRLLGQMYDDYVQPGLKDGTYLFQKPEHVAQEAIKILKYAPNGTLWLIEGGEPCYEFIPADRFTQKGNFLKTEQI
ncbi:15-hydroxyprostaglandin dehydrogenase [NAD(+)]-like [Diabrotica virgifera virgifera]|uniref:15-hydroxyprostaglandin dehydrogenase [NAD(+)]-like n=1 Tax=Diabrotica virgifera virgifera TaxID=50390 RepID=A0A6P7FF86_DIAVI|nr:15-hydroxyprostaglandin dehydrogenase [NAD(+)]-like [Diabrotica virgifera virgifera]